ncbi:MAG: hypothetical protein AAF126_03405, partial [Chloroflexota bacterium]
MPINVTWDNDDHKIVRHVYPQQWDLNDFHRAIEDNASLIESVTHRVDVIADLTQSKNIPPRMLSTIGHLSRRTPDNQGVTVIVGANYFVQLLLRAALTVVP